MFHPNAPSRKLAIGNPLCWSERVMLGLFHRGLAVGMQFTQSLISLVCQALNILGQNGLAGFKHLKIMRPASAKRGTKHGFRLFIDDHLRFLGVALLFAAIAPALLFWGRSTGCSLTSTPRLQSPCRLRGGLSGQGDETVPIAPSGFRSCGSCGRPWLRSPRK